MIEIRVPDLGLAPEDKISVSCWLVQAGDQVIEGDRLVELAIGEMTFDIASPASGRLVGLLAETDEPVAIGAVVGVIEPESD